MAFQQKDPFSWAEEFASTQHQRAAQEEALGQNALLNVFTQEMRRQQPYNDLPIDFAKQNHQYDLALRNSRSLLNDRIALTDANAKAKMLRTPPAKIGNAIKASAKTFGLDPDMMLVLADIESGYNPGAVSSTGAKGIFQVTSGYAQDNGIADPFNPQQNIDGTMRGTRKAIDQLSRAGVPINAGTIYLAHQQGTGGAIALLRNPNATAEQALAPLYGGNIAKARRAVVVNGGRPGMNAKMFADMWMTKAQKMYEHRLAMRDKDGGADRSARAREAMKLVQAEMAQDDTIEPDEELDGQPIE